MNKIYLEPMQKAESLIKGFKAQAEALSKKGIVADVDKLQQLCNALADAGAAQDEAEARLKEARAVAHDCLTALKECYTEMKTPVKQSFPPEVWLSFGLVDKK